MSEKKLKMCPDPKCSKESPEESEECIGCGLDFAGFSAFDNWLDVRDRRKAEESKKGKPAPQKKKSIFEGLRRK